MKARRVFYHKERIAGLIVEMVIWQLPQADAEQHHGLKYSLHCCREDGSLVVRYDNEHGKGDHRHYPEGEKPYVFESPEKLISDFLADIQRRMQ